ncbi:MAG: FAD-dependent oxidoreductase [Oligoflexia bacterium]|nr:FAD-dependent oxidoreductase [Oligoflexia bacterium]
MMKRFGVHKSVWKKDVSREPQPSLERDIDCDVVVVGAGITGLTTALYLKEAGLRVVVLDEHEVGAGTSGATTGHITAVPDIKLKTLVSHFGEDNSRLAVNSLIQAINQIENITQRYKINCEFKRVDSFQFAETSKQNEELVDQAEIAQLLGFDCQLTGELNLPFTFEGAIRFQGQAQFHALKYLYGIADKITGNESYLFENTRVHKIDDGEKCRLQTNRGEVVCSQLILATHTPIGRYISLQSRLAPYFSYVLAVRLKNPPSPGLYWDMNDPYFYMRQVGNPDDKLWIIGGCDHKTGQEVNTYERYLLLEEYIKQRFEVEDIQFYWGDEVFESVDGLPYVGKIPFTKNTFTATGFAGVGLTNATMSAKLMSDLILNKENELKELYDPSRVKLFSSFNKFTRENANVARRMVSDRMAETDAEINDDTQVDAVDCVASGEGKIVDRQGDKIAVYRDDTKHLHVFSPVCPHLGGIVHWNKAEKTWDCPCHGSRFSPTGEVLCGPALDDLEKVFIDAKAGNKRAGYASQLVDGLSLSCLI